MQRGNSRQTVLLFRGAYFTQNKNVATRKKILYLIWWAVCPFFYCKSHKTSNPWNAEFRMHACTGKKWLGLCCLLGEYTLSVGPTPPNEFVLRCNTGRAPGTTNQKQNANKVLNWAERLFSLLAVTRLLYLRSDMLCTGKLNERIENYYRCISHRCCPCSQGVGQLKHLVRSCAH